MGKDAYNWTFGPLGGAVRVNIRKGADIAHLGELDRKLWTVLSCPVNGLEFDQKTLGLLDSDSDGRIHVDEVIAASKWLTSVLKDPEVLMDGRSELKLSDFNSETEEGAKLQKSASQILSNLKLEKDSICLDDTADNAKIFADTLFNGDGVITEASAGGDETLAATIKTIDGICGGVPDRSGVNGVTAEQIEAFYAAVADYSAWQDAAGPETKPYGDDTPDALAAVEAVKAKVADFFMRCKLAGFDSDALPAVDVDVEKIKAISNGDLSAVDSEIVTYPLARPNVKGELPLETGLNPAWKGAFAKVKALVLDKDFPGKASITEADWDAVLAKFGPYCAWLADKKGEAVESLGLDAVKTLLKEDKKAALLDLVEKDKALESEALSIESVDKLLHLTRDFKKFLNNYVSFHDFYEDGQDSIFQAGQLYIDQRRLDLCIKVSDMGKHGDMAGLSGMFIIYCACVSKVTGKSFDIAAVITDGNVNTLRVGKNAIFYDRAGEVYDATITKIIDNPISVKQAFWGPYRKFGRWISERFTKKVSEKENKGFEGMTAKAEATELPEAGAAPAAAPAKPSSFDIAKFAGIFAAIGMAVAYLTQGLVAIAKGAANLGLWKVLLVLVALMLVISGPAMILAWLKLRKRDLGPVLNANGWAINATSYVNTKFGAGLTKLAKLPRLTAVDPKARRRARWRRFLWILFLLAVLAVAACFLCCKFGWHSFTWCPFC
ncbi:MAG: hypothetical protein IJM41_04025 [Bacteroidales bacterium]|nr:hypothetical protein [Bacteroidales bacterium]